MSRTKEPDITPEQLERNRKNAALSTGPRTPEGKRHSAMNRLTHGLYAHSEGATLAALGEDQEQFDELHERFIEEWQPRTATEEALVSRLAQLFWKQQRVERVQEGLAASQVEAFELERARQTQGSDRGTFEGLQARVYLVGLWGTKDSPGKFNEIIDYLDKVRGSVERGDFSPDVEEYLNTIYGEVVTWRGGLIRELLDALVHPNGTSAEVQRARVAELERLLDEEIAQAREAYELFRREKVETTPALRAAKMAPSDSQWTLAIRMENSIARQIDRTLKMLREMRSQKPEARSQNKSEGGPQGGDVAAAFTPAHATAKMKERSQEVVENKGPGSGESITSRLSKRAAKCVAPNRWQARCRPPGRLSPGRQA